MFQIILHLRKSKLGLSGIEMIHKCSAFNMKEIHDDLSQYVKDLIGLGYFSYIGAMVRGNIFGIKAIQVTNIRKVKDAN